MKYCEKCKISITGQQHRCPLCQGIVTGDDNGAEVFPVIPTIYHKYNFFFRLLIFISVIVATACVCINVLLPQSGRWSFIVVAAIGCMWLSLAIAVRKRGNIPKNVLYQVAVISTVSVIWDSCSGWWGWSLDYVVPFLCIAGTVVLAVMFKLTNLQTEDFVFYLFVNILFALIPLAAIIFGWLRILYPSVLCVASSVISLTAILLFRGEATKNELKKRFHI